METNKAWKCERCGKCYAQRRTLNRHRNLECGQEPKFNCRLCSFRSKRKEHLKHHMVRKHNESLMDEQMGFGYIPDYNLGYQ